MRPGPWWVLVGVVLLSGCAALPRPEMTHATPEAIATMAKPEDAVGLAADETLDVEISERQAFFVADDLDDSDVLPELQLHNVSFSNAGIYEIMRTLLAGTDIPFSVVGEPALVQRWTYSAVNLSGSLKSVMERLSAALGVFYTYRDGTLVLTPDKQFIVQLPPVEEVMESFPPMLKTLGATSIFLDRPGRTLTFRSSRQGYARIASYLDYIRQTRSLISYDIAIWEVILSDSSSTGIQWNRFEWNNPAPAMEGAGGGQAVRSLGLSGGAPGVPGGIGLGIVYQANRLSLDLLASFLKTQGTIKAVSQPKLLMLSGGKAGFRSGSTTNYVTQIGSQVTNNTTTTTVQTGQVLSGVELTLKGDVADGTVFTHISLKLTDLQRFLNVTAIGTNIQLPQTANREIETRVRSRAGHATLLAGINVEKDASEVSGLPGAGATVAAVSRADQSISRSEFVIVLKPRLINFVPASPNEAGAADRHYAVAPRKPPIAPVASTAPVPAAAGAAVRPASVVRAHKGTAPPLRQEPKEGG